VITELTCQNSTGSALTPRNINPGFQRILLYGTAMRNSGIRLSNAVMAI
jgi:hypothetical protein